MTERLSFPGWGQLRINDTIIHGFDSESIHTPTQIQAEAMPSILQGRSVVIHSATGTGKTRTALGLIYRLLKTRRFNRIG